MPTRIPSVNRSSIRWVIAGILALLAIGFLSLGLAGRSGPAAGAASGGGIGLGTASSFAVLAGSTVTNTGPSIITGDLGLSPGSAVTGFPPGLVFAGAQHVADQVALRAKNDLTTAYNQAASQPSTANVTGQDLGGKTLIPGVYQASTSMALTGNLTLNAQGNPDAVFIFKAGSTLVTASGSSVRFINGGSPCNVFWQVGSSATLHSTTSFVGTILAHTSAALQTGATVQGRVLAGIGAVTLDTNTITAPQCDTAPPSGTQSPSPTSNGPLTSTVSITATGTSTATGSSTAGGFPSPSTGSPTPMSSPPKTPTARVPNGYPHTGLGGTQDPPSRGGYWFGAAALAGAAALISIGLGHARGRAIRRRNP